MAMPTFSTGLRNYYQASLAAGQIEFDVLCIRTDALELPGRVSLVKVDVEGHELPALHGLASILSSHHPRLIVEGASDGVAAYLKQFGYSWLQLPGSPNRVFSV